MAIMSKTELSAKILRYRNTILAAIFFDFTEEAEKRQKNLQGKFYTANMHTEKN